MYTSFKSDGKTKDGCVRTLICRGREVESEPTTSVIQPFQVTAKRDHDG